MSDKPGEGDTMGKLVYLAERKQAAVGPAHEELVATLEWALTEAKAGNVTAMAIVLLNGPDSCGRAIVFDDHPLAMLRAVSMLYDRAQTIVADCEGGDDE